MRPLAVTVMPLETRHDTILNLALRADELGYQAFLLPETWSYDATLLLAEIAVHTQRIHLGTGILGVWGRSAGQIAMAAATLNTIANGRFLLGLGASTRQLTEGLHDVPYSAPYRKLRQTITQVRALLAGERIPLAGAAGARPLQLNLPAQPELPLLLAASSPASLRIAGELCDGWLPFLYPRDSLPAAIARLEEAAARSHRLPHPYHICPSIPTVVSDDPEQARAGAAWFVAFYLTTMGPLYRQALARLGYEKEVAAILRANAGQKPAVVPPEAESLLEQLTLYGTPDQVRAQLDPWYGAGATMPTLVLAPGLGSDDLDLVLAACRLLPAAVN